MRILFATDGSRGAGIAEDFLLALPLSCADAVTVLTVPAGSERDSFALLSRVRWRFAARGIPTTTAMRAGHPAGVVEAVAFEHQSELIVVGSRGLGTITGALMGSVARALARNAPAPVLVVRAHRDAPGASSSPSMDRRTHARPSSSSRVFRCPTNRVSSCCISAIRRTSRPAGSGATPARCSASA